MQENSGRYGDDDLDHKVISLYIECDRRGDLRQLNSADQSVWAESVGPVHYRCTDPTVRPHQLISCVQLAQNRLPYPPPPLSHSTLLYGVHIGTGRAAWAWSVGRVERAGPPHAPAACVWSVNLAWIQVCRYNIRSLDPGTRILYFFQFTNYLSNLTHNLP